MLLTTSVHTGDRPGPHLLITGGVHGDEFEPMVALRRLIERPELRQLRGRLTIVPVVNEAALARGNRVADDGLDLARTCPGHTCGSVTERTAAALSDLIRAADCYIDLHTGGAALTVWPMTGYMLHPHPAVLARQRTMARAFNLPVVWGTDPRLEGRSLSIAREANVPAIYAEYLGGGRCSVEGVHAYEEGCLNVMAALDMLTRAEPTPQVRMVVEDRRPGSGHMQRCYPAPVGGCFESEVQVGQWIEAGRSLGTIADSLGRARRDVIAEQSGHILVLRTFPAVQPGDSLAVILETN